MIFMRRQQVRGLLRGLRIGVVTVKAMAYAHNKPVCAVPTLMPFCFFHAGFQRGYNPNDGCKE